MKQTYEKVGAVRREHAALALDLPGWQLGRLVIGAAGVEALFRGDPADVNFVQERPGREPFIGLIGQARVSRSGKALNVRLEGRLLTAPLQQIRAVNEGRRTAATLSKIIDADGEQQGKPIDHGLEVRG